MKLPVSLFVFCLSVALVYSNHTFLGTNVQRPLVYHNVVSYSANVFTKRIEYFKFSIPFVHNQTPRYIQGILAYDLTDTGASANVTEGGIGSNTVTLRMKSDKGKKLKFDIYIYA